MKNLLFLLIVFFVITNSNAQWKKLASGTKKNLNDTYFIDRNLGYAVGDSGAIIKTTDGGVTWLIQNSTVVAKLASVFFTDAANGYVVGDSALLLKTTNGGLNWVKQSLGLPLSVSFNSIYFTTDSTGYITSNSIEAISNSSIILRTSNKWLSWSVDTLGVGVTSSIFFSSKDTGYLAGNCIRKTTNAGKDWQSLSYNNINLKGVTRNGYDYNILAVGDSGKIVYGKPTTDMFTIINPGTTENLNYIKYDSYYHYYNVVGNHGTILRNDDSNPITNWTSINSGVTCNLNCISTIEQTDYSNIIVGDSGTILKSKDLGSTWVKINSGVVNNLYSYAGNHGYNERGYIVGDSGVILRLVNSTVTKIQTGLTNKKLNYICYNGTYFTELGYYIVGDKGTIIRTTNDFNTVTIQNVDPTIDLYYIHFYNANATPTNSGFACGFDHARNESVILYTTDGGTNWHKNYTGFTTKIKGGDDQDEYIAGEGGTILYAPKANYPTSYNYKYWIHYNCLSNVESLGSVFFTNNNNGFAVNRNSKLVKTKDGGNNWSLLAINNINSIFFTDALNGYVAGSSGTIRKTTNSGASWVSQTTGTTNNLNKVYFPNENSGYAVGNTGTIIKTWIITVNNPVICKGDSTILTASGDGVLYNWSNGKTGDSISVRPAATTTYTVTGTSADGFSDTKGAVVTVTQPPNVTTAIDKPNINSGQSANLCASGGDSYTWNTGEFTPCITVSPTVTTTYTVIGRNNKCGLTDTAIAVVTVGAATGVGYTHINNYKILLYPIPAKDKVTIESTQQLKGNLIVYNVNGQELIRQQINENKAEINIGNFASGIYYVKIIADQTIEIRKIIKE
jgi:photosystem II stability/assembly factor-like uncharacterized protein